MSDHVAIADMFRRFPELQLSRLERQCIGHYCAGMSYKEISARVGRDVRSVGNALQRVKGRLWAAELEREKVEVLS